MTRGGVPGAACAAALLLGSASAAAHGGDVDSRSPWLQGVSSLASDPACVLLVAVLALLMAQPDQPPRRQGLIGGALGLALGLAVAAAGAVVDTTLLLLALAIVTGALVAGARPWSPALHAALAAAVGTGVMLVQAPAPTSDVGDRLAWLGGVLLATLLLFVNVLNLALALMGRRPGPVRRMLLRVLGSWITTAALLVLVLETVRRNA